MANLCVTNRRKLISLRTAKWVLGRLYRLCMLRTSFTIHPENQYNVPRKSSSYNTPFCFPLSIMLQHNANAWPKAHTIEFAWRKSCLLRKNVEGRWKPRLNCYLCPHFWMKLPPKRNAHKQDNLNVLVKRPSDRQITLSNSEPWNFPFNRTINWNKHRVVLFITKKRTCTNCHF